jgi:fibronectin type 3 domain-containing protein
MKTKNIIGILLTLCSVTLFAQNPVKGVAGAGPDKIYINLGTELLSKKMPFNDCIAYRIERKQMEEKLWTQLAEIECTTSKSNFESKLADAMNIVPNPLPLNSIPVDKIWEKVEKYYRLDSLKFWGMLLPVRIALGITYVDTDAKAGITYEFRISKINSTGKVISQVLSFPIAFPGRADFQPPILVEQDAKEKRIILKWISAARKRPSSFECFRQDQLQGEFKNIAPLRAMTITKDSMFLMVSDSIVDPMYLYRYYIVPRDFYGNSGVPSDTALVGSYDFKSIPLPDNINAASLDSIGGIQLQWHLSNPSNVKSLKIFRSTEWEKGYKQIGEISSNRNTYIDQNAEPMVKYFYYITMTGVLGEESPASAKVFGIFQSALTPVRPWILKYDGTMRGMRLEIASPETDVVGYRIYRSVEGREMLLITDLLLKRDSITVFVDQDSTLSGNIQYGYAVRAENASHRLSDMSDTVYARPLKSTQTIAPRDLSADAENSIVKLYWTDMQPLDQNLEGYIIYRREVTKQKQTEFIRIFERPLAANINRYIDTITQEGKVYEYTVQSIDIYGNTSSLSNPVRAEVFLTMPVPPEGIRARKTDAGVLVQWDETFQKDVAGYNVYRYIRGITPKFIGGVKQNTLEYTDKAVRKGELYFYYITTVTSKTVESLPSREVSIRP